MNAPVDLYREAATEAVLADQRHAKVLSLQTILEAATIEVLLLVKELDNPTPATTAERRHCAIWMAAQLMRSGQVFEDWAL